MTFPCGGNQTKRNQPPSLFFFFLGLPLCLALLSVFVVVCFFILFFTGSGSHVMKPSAMSPSSSSFKPNPSLHLLPAAVLLVLPLLALLSSLVSYKLFFKSRTSTPPPPCCCCFRRPAASPPSHSPSSSPPFSRSFFPRLLDPIPILSVSLSLSQSLSQSLGVSVCLYI